MNLWEIHPALVHFPIALLIAAVVLDLAAGGQVNRTRIATGLMIAGVVMGLLAAAAGVLAFYTVPAAHTEKAHDEVIWHLGIAAGSVVLFLLLSIVRWRTRDVEPSSVVKLLGVIAAVGLILGAYLGGDIVYHGGMGVDPSILAPSLQHHHHDDGQQGH